MKARRRNGESLSSAVLGVAAWLISIMLALKARLAAPQCGAK